MQNSYTNIFMNRYLVLYIGYVEASAVYWTQRINDAHMTDLKKNPKGSSQMMFQNKFKKESNFELEYSSQLLQSS